MIEASEKQVMAFKGIAHDDEVRRLRLSLPCQGLGSQTLSPRASFRWLVVFHAVTLAFLLQALPSPGLRAAESTSPFVPCPNPESQELIKPPEFQSSNGILKGTIVLTQEFQRLPISENGVVIHCSQQLVRVFRGEGLPMATKAKVPNKELLDPIPGPTLRARVGDLVQLTFVNEVDSNRFDKNIELEKCMHVADQKGGEIYPGETQDQYPNCLHASSTANIHFHGTHTTPNSTGDNIFLHIRPLPRDNQGNLTTSPAGAAVGLDNFFKQCTEKLKNPLERWPASWSDLSQEAQAWTGKQRELLIAFEKANPDQPLWSKNEMVLNEGKWPQYYVGLVPYCFALPVYTGGTSPVMGQVPGTHWYHAHKHGSTAINVASGMTGAFIIEGQYDEDLNAFYSKFILKDGKSWNTRSQHVLVLNQLGTTPNALVGGGPTAVDFTVNGRLRPKIEMQPGEVQLWRILNTSGRSAAYFMLPEGLEWRQLAQDGVQLADQIRFPDNLSAEDKELVAAMVADTSNIHARTYQNSHNKPFYMAPANRVDLLVRAPMTVREVPMDIRIQNVMSRSGVQSTTTTILMSVTVAGPPVMRDGKPSQMPFLESAPARPKFLADITDEELWKNNYGTKTLDFNSKVRGAAPQHTINGIQFENGSAHVRVMLGATEEWTIRNFTTNAAGQEIDHPFHIHINPFQVTEVFDPNELLTDPKTGRMGPLKKYVVDANSITDPRQCVLNANNPDTWRPCRSIKQTNLAWWDVFAMPSGVMAPRKDGTQVTIPGYFKMRSRFVDYPGLYVLHCHILIHEDRGMMFSVEVIDTQPTLMQHH